jgi:uncharacterized membrane protein YeiH
VVVIAHVFQLPPVLAAIVGGILCFALRFGAIRRGWRLPAAGPPAPNDEKDP